MVGRRLILALPLAALLLAPVAAAEREESVLRIGTTQPVASFDPDEATDIDGAAARDAVYEGLVAYAPGEGGIVGRLARSWTVSVDGLTYTFTLRPGVSFHDGTRLTSADVLASFQRRLDPAHRLSGSIGRIAHMEAPDPATFVVHLGQPSGWFLDALAGAWGPRVISATALRDHADPAEAGPWFATHEAGTGPYRLAAHGERGTALEKFAAYWGDPAHFDRVALARLPDPAAQVARLRHGVLEGVTSAIPPAAALALPPQLAATRLPSGSMLVASVNPVGALIQPAARTAVLTALNPRFWLRGQFGDQASVAHSLIPSLMLETLEPAELPDDLGVARKAALRMTQSVTLGYRQEDSAALREVAEAIAGNLRQIGVSVAVLPCPAQAVAAFAADPGLGPDVFLERTRLASAHPHALVLWFLDAQFGNVFGVRDPTAVRLAGQADALVAPAAAAKRYQLFAERLFATSGFIPLAELNGQIVHRKGLGGLAGRPGFPPGYFDFALADGG